MTYNIVVLVKQIPTLELVKINPSTEEPILEGVPFRLETLSKNAIEAAVRIKEKYGGKVSAVIFGNDKSSQVMKEAYALGVDDGYILTGYVDGNTSLTAAVLAKKVRQLPHDMVILGNQSADTMTGLLGGMVSALLDYPLLSNALTIDLNDRVVKVLSAGESQSTEMQATLPLVVSVTQETNEPRFPPVMKIIQAGKKSINVEAADVSGKTEVKILSRKAPLSSRKQVLFEDVEKGAQEVAKVIKEAIR